MLDDKKMQMIELLMLGTLNKSEIAKAVNISRQTLYDWSELEQVKVEMDRRRHDLENSRKIADNIFLNYTLEMVEDYRNFIKSTKNEMAKKQAIEYWLDRGLGKIPTKTEITDNREESKSKLTPDQIEAELAALRGTVE